MQVDKKLRVLALLAVSSLSAAMQIDPSNTGSQARPAQIEAPHADIPAAQQPPASAGNPPQIVNKDSVNKDSANKDAPAQQSPIPTAEPVLVTAPEPRYVAPTLRDRIGRIWAPVMINGKGPFRLVLDTGANSAAVIDSVAKQLGIQQEKSKKVMLQGVTGEAVVPIITVDSMEVGDLLLGKSNVPVVSDVFGGAEGVLGNKGLADKRIFIDFRRDIIRIARSRNEMAPPGFTRLPVSMNRGQLLTLELYIGGVRTKAILDTGAQQTIGNNSLREALLKRAREGKEQEIVGVTLDVEYGQSIRVPPVALGDIRIRNMHITFGDMFIFKHWKMTNEPAMLIGMDVIGVLDTLIIDYRRRELQLKARS